MLDDDADNDDDEKDEDDDDEDGAIVFLEFRIDMVPQFSIYNVSGLYLQFN